MLRRRKSTQEENQHTHTKDSKESLVSKEEKENMDKSQNDQNTSQTDQSPSTPKFITEVLGDNTETTDTNQNQETSEKHDILEDSLGLTREETQNPTTETGEKVTSSMPILGDIGGDRPQDKGTDLDSSFFDEPGKKKQGSFIVPLLIAILVVLAGALAFFSFKYNQLQGEIASKEDKQKKSGNATDDSIIDKVSALASISPSDQPMITTIIDSAKLRESSPLFADVKDGDKLVIVGDEVFVYRPEDNRMIATGSVSFKAMAGEDSQTATAGATLAKPKFVLRNGTTINGLTKKFEPTLKKAASDAIIVARENAKKNDYQKSIIIDLTRKYTKEVKDLAKTMDLTVEELPDGEPKPAGADFLIILGTDVG